MIKRVLYIVIATVLLASCSSDSTGGGQSGDLKDFLAKSTEGIYVNKQGVMVLDEAEHQVAVNPTALTYRIQNDAQTIYMNVKLSAKPTSKETPVTVTVTSRGLQGVLGSYSMTLEKSAAGRMWLWDSGSATGIIVAL